MKIACRQRAVQVLCGLFFTLLNGLCAEVQLIWDPSGSPDVVAYRLYQTESTNAWPVGWNAVATKTNALSSEPDLSFVITNLALGTHRWVLTAISAFDVESEPSNEAALILEKPSPPLRLRVGGAGSASVTTTLMRSFDLQNWEPMHVWTEPTNAASYFCLQFQHTQPPPDPE